MPTTLDLQMLNELDALAPVTEAVLGLLEQHNASPGATFACNLALEELITNIIKYGYDNEDPHQIAIRLIVDATHFELQITDDGHPFNPFDRPEPDTTLPIEEREIGGLGIHFIRNLLDTWHYERCDDRNIVTVRKAMTA